jgi:hypothetical protein
VSAVIRLPKSFSATERLHQQSKGHSWEFHVNIIEHRHQLVGWVYTVDDDRHF